jgi:hypothetical protein
MEVLTLAWCWTCRRRHCEQWSDGIEMVSVKGLIIQRPHLQVTEVTQSFGQGKRIRDGVSSINLDPLLYQCSFARAQETSPVYDTFLCCPIRKVDDEKPRGYRRDLSQQAFDYLARVNYTTLSRHKFLTKIHRQPLRSPTPSICMRPYARICENPLNRTENR